MATLFEQRKLTLERGKHTIPAKLQIDKTVMPLSLPLHWPSIWTYMQQYFTANSARFYINQQKRCLVDTQQAQELALTDKECTLLTILMAGKTSKATLLKKVWGIEQSLDTHTLDTHLYRLRQKFQAAQWPMQIIANDDSYEFVTL